MTDHPPTLFLTGSASPATPRATLPGLPERYEDRTLLATGGMSQVRRVWDRHLQRLVALKVLRWDLADDEGARSRFAEEARVTAAVQHPGVVALFDRGVLDDDRPWLTMAEVRGETLHQHLRARHGEGVEAHTLRSMVGLVLRVCETIAHAHNRGIVHRDLKPDNVMLGPFGEVLVMDWGLAFAPTEGRAPLDSDDPLGPPPGMIAGTPHYMAPEQASGSKVCRLPPTDVYALGGILHTTLTGRPTLEGPGLQCIDRLRRPEPLPLLQRDRPSWPSDLLAILRRALSWDPASRHADAGELARDLRGWLDGAERQARAHEVVEDAASLRPAITALRSRSSRLRQRALQALEALPPFAPSDDKRTAWQLEEQADTLSRQATVRETLWLQKVRSALELDPDCPSAHAALAEHYQQRLMAAEARRDDSTVAEAEVMLQAHDRGRFAAVLSRQARLDLVTDPPGAMVHLERCELQGRRLVPRPVKTLGPTPLEDVDITAGSYLARIQHPDRVEVRYPIHVERGGHWRGIRPGQAAPTPVVLPRELPSGCCYVPAGWCLVGGDPDAFDSLARTRVWIDAFVITTHPITTSQYLVFLDDLARTGRLGEALEHAPRLDEGAHSPALFVVDDGGRFTVRPDANGVAWPGDWPITRITWWSAVAYARWLAERTGLPWTLPGELQWEKAARGVDGRFCAWGDHLEPTWAAMEGSSPLPSRTAVSDFETDQSPYGVRGTVGNVRDWCADLWTPTGPAPDQAIPPTRLADPTDEQVLTARGGAWASTPSLCRAAVRFGNRPGQRFDALGFRLVYDPSAV